jgi:hypothetical protein
MVATVSKRILMELRRSMGFRTNTGAFSSIGWIFFSHLSSLSQPPSLSFSPSASTRLNSFSFFFLETGSLSFRSLVLTLRHSFLALHLFFLSVLLYHSHKDIVGLFCTKILKATITTPKNTNLRNNQKHEQKKTPNDPFISFKIICRSK